MAPSNNPESYPPPGGSGSIVSVGSNGGGRGAAAIVPVLPHANPAAVVAAAGLRGLMHPGYAHRDCLLTTAEGVRRNEYKNRFIA